MKKKRRKKTVSDLIREYEKPFYATLSEEGERSWLEYRVLSLILGRLRSIEEWLPNEKRLARQKKEEAIQDLRAYNCLPWEYRKEQCAVTFERLRNSPDALGAALDRRWFMLKMNRMAKDAADRLEAIHI
jgi:hypothetical protein